jgi:hypothetical protein
VFWNACPHRDLCNGPSTILPDSPQLEGLRPPLNTEGRPVGLRTEDGGAAQEPCVSSLPLSALAAALHSAFLCILRIRLVSAVVRLWGFGALTGRRSRAGVRGGDGARRAQAKARDEILQESTYLNNALCHN